MTETRSPSSFQELYQHFVSYITSEIFSSSDPLSSDGISLIRDTALINPDLAKQFVIKQDYTATARSLMFGALIQAARGVADGNKALIDRLYQLHAEDLLPQLEHDTTFGQQHRAEDALLETYQGNAWAVSKLLKGIQDGNITEQSLRFLISADCSELLGGSNDPGEFLGLNQALAGLATYLMTYVGKTFSEDDDGPLLFAWHVPSDDHIKHFSQQLSLDISLSTFDRGELSVELEETVSNPVGTLQLSHNTLTGHIELFLPEGEFEADPDKLKEELALLDRPAPDSISTFELRLTQHPLRAFTKPAEGSSCYHLRSIPIEGRQAAEHIATTLNQGFTQQCDKLAYCIRSRGDGSELLDIFYSGDANQLLNEEVGKLFEDGQPLAQFKATNLLVSPSPKKQPAKTVPEEGGHSEHKRGDLTDAEEDDDSDEEALTLPPSSELELQLKPQLRNTINGWEGKGLFPCLNGRNGFFGYGGDKKEMFLKALTQPGWSKLRQAAQDDIAQRHSDLFPDSLTILILDTMLKHLYGDVEGACLTHAADSETVERTLSDVFDQAEQSVSSRPSQG